MICRTCKGEITGQEIYLDSNNTKTVEPCCRDCYERGVRKVLCAKDRALKMPADRKTQFRPGYAAKKYHGQPMRHEDNCQW